MAKPDLCRVEGLAVTQAHQVERLLRGEYRAMASARVVGMTMRDHGLVHGPCGVDMETADFAVHAGRRRQENIFGAHGLEIWCKWRNDRWTAAVIALIRSAIAVGIKSSVESARKQR